MKLNVMKSATAILCIQTAVILTNSEQIKTKLLHKLQQYNNGNNNINIISDYILQVTKIYFNKSAVLQILLPKHCKIQHNVDISICNIDSFIQNLYIKKQLLISGFNISHKHAAERYDFKHGAQRSEMLQIVKLKIKSILLFVNADKIMDELRSQVNILRKQRLFWNPRAAYLIVIVDLLGVFVNDEATSAMETLNYLWGENIFRVVLLYIYSRNYKETKIIKASPYSSEKICGRLTNTEDLQYSLLLDNMHLLPNYLNFKFEENFQGCSINVSTQPTEVYAIPNIVQDKYVYTSGIEVNMMQVFADKCNVKVVYKPESLNVNPLLEILPNGNARGILPNLDDLKIDIAFGFYGFTTEQLLYAEHTTTYHMESLAWCVPSPNLMPTYKVFLKIFDTQIWISMVITFVLVNFVIYLMKTLSFARITETKYSSIVSNAFVLYGMFFNIPESKVPKSGYLKLVLILWAVYSLHLSTAYQQKLFSFMTNPLYEKGITTFEELRDSGLKTCLHRIFYRGYAGKLDTVLLNSLLDNHVYCGDNLENGDLVKYVIDNRNVSFIIRNFRAEFLANKHKSKLYKLDVSLLIYPVGMFTSKGSIVHNCLNKCIRTIVESGFFDKFKKDAIPKYKIKTDISSEPFTIYDLQGAFLVLFINLTICLFVFLTECLWHKMYKL